MTNDDEIKAARDADRIFNDPLFKSAFDRIEGGLIDKMRIVPMADIDTQHELVISLQLLGALRNQFVSIMQTGKMAELQREQSLAQKVRKFVQT
jgi:hypothetical protein